MLPQVSVLKRVAFWVALFLAFGLLAMLVGLVGAFFGWFAQLFLLSIAVPVVLMLVDYRLGLMLVVILMPYSLSKLIPKAGPLSLMNVLLLGVCLAFLLRWMLHRMAGKHIVFPVGHALGWLYLLPLTIATLVGSLHVGEISQIFLAFSHQDSFDLKEYWVSLYFKATLMVMIACIFGAAVVERGEGLRFAVATVVSGVTFVLALVAVILGTGASLEDLKNARTLLEVLGSHNNEAGVMLLAPLAAALFMREFVTSRMARFALLMALLILVAGVALTFSRGAFAGLVVMLGFYVWHFKRLGLGLGVFTLAVAGLALAPNAIQERLMTGVGQGESIGEQLTGRVEGDEFTAGRVWIWSQLSPEILRSPIIGRGLLSTQWSAAAKDGRYHGTHPHSLYLEVLMDLGFVGAVCIALFYVYIWKLFGKLAEDIRLVGATRGYFLGAKAGLLGMLVYGFSNGHYYPAHEQLFFWISVGLALGYQRYLAGRPVASAAQHAAKPTNGRHARAFRIPETSILRPR